MPALLPKGVAMPVKHQTVKMRIKWDAAGDVDGFIFGTDKDGKTVLFPACGHPLEAQNGGKAPAISGYFIAAKKGGVYPNDFGCANNPFNWVVPAEDARDGTAAGWDEESVIFLDKVPPEIARLDVVVAIYPQQEDGTPNPLTFAQVENVAVELADENDKTIVAANAEFTNPAMWGLQGIWFCSLTRTATAWEFKNVMFADAAKFGYYNDFQDMVRATIPDHNV